MLRPGVLDIAVNYPARDLMDIWIYRKLILSFIVCAMFIKFTKWNLFV